MMSVSDLLEQPCNKSDNTNKLITGWLLATCSKLVENLEQAMRTQLVDGLFASLLQVVRFLRACSVPLGWVARKVKSAIYRTVIFLSDAEGIKSNDTGNVKLARDEK